MKDAGMNYITREAILKMLSDEEITKVTIEEEPSRLIEGDEYLDLEHLDRGIQQVHESSNINAANVIARSAIAEDTWSKIISKFYK